MKKKEENIHVQTPGFNPLTDEEADRIMGALDDPHNGGICLIPGFACNNKGGLKLGICILYGVAVGIWTPIGRKEQKEENK